MNFSVKDISQFAAFAERLADAARAETLSRFRAKATIFNKAGQISDLGFDPVTNADREAERVLRAMIQSVYPSHGVLGEEFGETEGDSPWRWVLDPVDGTRAFMCGVPSWATLIALEYRGAPVLGLIDQPFTGERWIGFCGKATLTQNSARAAAKTSGLLEIAKARISTTDPLATGYFSEVEAAAFARIAKASRVARYSLDAYAYGLLAIGELDLVIESGLKRHDYAALIPIVEGAGGVVSDWKGETPGGDESGELIASATQKLHDTALALLAR